MSLVLGLLQGLTEFFPVSSSGHLKLMEKLFGFEHLDQLVLFDLTCHIGTLLALVAVFKRDLLALKKTDVQILCLALLPLFPAVVVLRYLHSLYGSTAVLGVCFLVTAALLYLGEKLAAKEKAMSPRSAFLIGVAQTAALLPGLSRSGATISMGRWQGLSRDKAVRFSFLLAIPTMLGGLVVELIHLKGAELPPIGLMPYVVGPLTALVTGFFALKGLFKLVQRHSLKPFVWYCVVVGVITLVWA